MGNKKKGKILAVLLSGALIGTQIPGMTVAEGAAGYIGGICGHHPVHTAECGYQEAVPEQPCRHEHTKECYEYVTSCVHVHTEECYPLIAIEVPSGDQDTEGTAEDAGTTETQTEWVRVSEPTACTHVCSEDSGCVTKTLNCIHEDTINADGSITYAVHDESCGYAPAVEGKECTFVCEICSIPGDQEEEIEVPTGQNGTEVEEPGTETSTEKTPDSDAETETDEAVTKVQAQIDALPTVDEVRQMTKDEQEEVYDKAQDAADAYFDELTEEQQEQVDLTKLMDLMNYFNGQVATMAGVVATVTINGNTTTYTDLKTALKDAGALGTTATVTLQQNTTLTGNYFINGNVTFVGGNYKVTGTFDIEVETGGTFTVKSGTLNSGGFGTLCCSGGTIIVDGGNIDTLYRYSGIIIINGGTIKSVQESGGSITYNPPDETVSIQSVSAGKIEVTPLSNTTTFGGAQYSLDGTNWQSSNELNCKADTSYTVYARYSNAITKIWSTAAKSSAASYTVTIPSATLTAGDSISKAEISVDTSENFDLGYNGQVQVKVESGGAVSSDGSLTLTRQGASDTLTSAMYVNKKEFTNIDNPVAVFKMDNYDTAKAAVSFAQPETTDTTQTVIPAGTYSGTVTFEVTYSD